MQKKWVVPFVVLVVALELWIQKPTTNKAYFNPNIVSQNFASDRLIVSYKGEVNTLQRNQVLSDIRVVTSSIQKRETLLPNMEVLVLKDKALFWDTFNRLSNHPAVAFVEPDYEVKLLFGSRKKKKKAPAEPDIPFPMQRGQPSSDPFLDRTYGLYKIQAPQSWEIHRGSSNVIVAVIDSGIDYLHEDLTANLWYNPGEIQNDGIDNDNDGFIDDIIGWDFRNNDNKPYDDNAHGTHVAGTIGAVGENGRGISGVIQKVSIMALKFTNNEGSGRTSDAISAIRYAVDHGANILSNSWGGENFTQALYDAVKYAQERGVLFIAAAGNGGNDSRGDDIDRYPTYPAAFDLDNVISVAATNSHDELEYFSNFGKNSVDLGAPGVYIYSTVPKNKYEAFSGTSMATPHVAGGAALLLSYKPNLSFTDIKNILLSSTDKLPTLNNKSVSGGRLNVRAALTSASVVVGQNED